MRGGRDSGESRLNPGSRGANKTKPQGDLFLGGGTHVGTFAIDVVEKKARKMADKEGYPTIVVYIEPGGFGRRTGQRLFPPSGMTGADYAHMNFPVHQAAWLPPDERATKNPRRRNGANDVFSPGQRVFLGARGT